MPQTVNGQVYDFAAECLTCGDFAVFGDKTERREWADAKHVGHEMDFHLQGRV
jgi:hypothetical protein